LENCLASLTAQKLHEIADACGLDVETGSLDILIDCIMKQENHKAPKKKKAKKEKVSKEKPSIKKGITQADLYTHFYRQELHDFCQKKKLATTGNKRDFIKRILAYVEGREQPVYKIKGAKRTKKRKAEGSGDEKDPKRIKLTNVDSSDGKSLKTHGSEEESDEKSSGRSTTKKTSSKSDDEKTDEKSPKRSKTKKASPKSEDEKPEKSPAKRTKDSILEKGGERVEKENVEDKKADKDKKAEKKDDKKVEKKDDKKAEKKGGVVS